MPPHDPAALADALVEVLRDRPAYVEPRAEIAACFDPERSLDEYEALFERLVGRDGRRAMSRSPYCEGYYEEHGLDEDRIALWFYARLLRRLRPRGGRLLDFGCGTGHLLRRLSDHFETYGYDASAVARSRCRLTAAESLVLEEWESIAADSLDVIVSLHTLEHLERPLRVMQPLAAKLRPRRPVPLRRPQPRRPRPPPQAQGLVRLPRPDPRQPAEPRRVGHAGAPRRPDVLWVRGDGMWDPPYVGLSAAFLAAGPVRSPGRSAADLAALAPVPARRASGSA